MEWLIDAILCPVLPFFAGVLAEKFCQNHRQKKTPSQSLSITVPPGATLILPEGCTVTTVNVLGGTVRH